MLLIIWLNLFSVLILPFIKLITFSKPFIEAITRRKAYLIIQNRDHLNKDGLEKIIKLKNTMNRLSDTKTV